MFDNRFRKSFQLEGFWPGVSLLEIILQLLNIICKPWHEQFYAGTIFFQKGCRLHLNSFHRLKTVIFWSEELMLMFTFKNRKYAQNDPITCVCMYKDNSQSLIVSIDATANHSSVSGKQWRLTQAIEVAGPSISCDLRRSALCTPSVLLITFLFLNLLWKNTDISVKIIICRPTIYKLCPSLMSFQGWYLHLHLASHTVSP